MYFCLDGWIGLIGWLVGWLFVLVSGNDRVVVKVVDAISKMLSQGVSYL